MNSFELFIAIQNIDKLPPSRLPKDVVEWMVRCLKEGWGVEYINDPLSSNKWLEVKGRIADSMLENFMKNQMVSCYRISTWNWASI